MGLGRMGQPPSQPPSPPGCLQVPLPQPGARDGWSGGCCGSPFSGQNSLPCPPAYLGNPSHPSAKALQATPGPQSVGTVVIIGILSVLLAVLFTVLALLIYTW